MTTEEFDFDLPKELIAQTPLEKRDTSRLLVLDKQTGEITHRDFTDIISYMEKGDTLDNPYVKMSKIMVDIFKLYDKLEVKAREYYSNGVSGKKYGLVTGVTKKKDGKAPYKTKFYKNNTDYVTPNGFLLPILGAFRALVDKDQDGYYFWKKNPFEIMDKVGADLMESTVDMSRTLGNNPNAAGKNRQLWKNLYMCVAMETMHKD